MLLLLQKITKTRLSTQRTKILNLEFIHLVQLVARGVQRTYVAEQEFEIREKLLIQIVLK